MKSYDKFYKKEDSEQWIHWAKQFSKERSYILLFVHAWRWSKDRNM
jgi:hypothetical protein